MLFSKAHLDKNEVLERIEELLILSDIGPQVTQEILVKFQEIGVHQYKVNDFNHFKKQLKKILLEMTFNEQSIIQLIQPSNPNLIQIDLIVGVNGTGKTSFSGKLAFLYKNMGKKILLIPADTFRAGAIEQLSLLAKQTGVDVVNTFSGADPASVVFDGIKTAIAKGKDTIIIDTAGRLHTYHNLMMELEKVKRVIQKTAPEALLKTYLVIDATTGQNGFTQVQKFKEIMDISGLVLTKLDGTAKGGVVLTIQKELKIPVAFITFGEKLSNLSQYKPAEFIEALLD